MRQNVEHPALARADDLDAIGGICGFSRARQPYYAADAGAVSAYESAPEHERSFGDESGARTDLAIARIARLDLDGAYEAIQPVLRLPITQRIHGVIGSVVNVHQAVTTTAPDAPIAQEMQEEIEEYCRTPIAALPR